MNIAQLFWQAQPLFGDRPVIYVGEEAVTHDALAAQIRAMTGALRARGVGVGDRVILAMNNCAEWMVSLLAILGTGAICVPVNPGLRPREISNIAAHSKPNLAIIDAELADHFAETTVKFDRIVRNGGDSNDWHRVAASAEQSSFVAEVKDTDAALIFYTSGTTGLPKGVLLSHGAEVYTATMVSKHLDIGPRDTSIVMGSLAFIYPLIINALAAMHGGASIVLQDRFHPQLASDAVKRHRVTIMMGVPTMYVMMMNYADQASVDFSSVRLAFSGGASLGDALCSRARNTLGFELFDLWGMTECTPVTTFDHRIDERGQPDSCGRALPGCAFRIVDDDLNAVPFGTVGEILLTGPMVMTGYYLNPPVTAETLIDGWIRSGDLGSTDDDGFLYIVGRKKDLIIRGGANVYPVDVEEALYAHHDVGECAVIGKPDVVFGESIKAYVVRKTTALSSRDLMDHCKTLLADYKVPSEIEFVAELPKGPTGKILRRELRDLTAAG